MKLSQLAAEFNVVITRRNDVWTAKRDGMVVASGINLTVLRLRLKAAGK